MNGEVVNAIAVSNRKKKVQRRRMKVAALKQNCGRPDLVEIWDTTSSDPKLLVFLKSCRNTVAVPRHWSHKRKYLQGKQQRGIPKPPFYLLLPDFIAQKHNQRIRPKMGNLEIDYQVLYDAFFKFQTKPKLTVYGDLYYEGKEFDEEEANKLREMLRKPRGTLSNPLKEALGMPTEVEGGLNATLPPPPPPPWLINMQRYGPPPSYPHLKIPGLNAPPLPPGSSFGYQPVVDKSQHWGDFEEQEQEEQEEEELEQEEELEDGIDSLSNGSSTPTTPTPTTGVETPDDVIELRKQLRKEPEKPLYQVLQVKEEIIAPPPTLLLRTTHTYLVPKSGAKRVDLLRGHNKADRSVDVSLQPDELELELEAGDRVLASKYQQAREEERLLSQREDFSVMVAENENKRKRIMLVKDAKSKKKDFKF